MAAGPYSKPSQAPCDDCVHRANCAASRLVCQAFNAYVGGRTRSAWQGLPRIPGKRLTLQVRKAEAVDLPEGTVQTSAKLRRLGRREAKKAWKRRNREAVRASKRAWAARHRQKYSEAARIYREAHREQVSAASRAWEALNRERRLELRGLWHALNRDRVNAQQRARYAKRRERLLEAERRCAQLRIYGETRTGEMLKVVQKAKGTRGNFDGRDASGPRTLQAPETARTLEQLGISETQSSRWQQRPALPVARCDQ